MKHWKYLRYVCRHKWFVFRECLKYGLIWRGLQHDWSKFLPSEWIPYAEYFYGGGKNETAFDLAWLHHLRRCDHHWQYWLLQEDDGELKILEMPEVAMKEMLCDWRGAGRAIHGKDETLSWYSSNKHKMKLHPRTRSWIEGELGIFRVVPFMGINDRDRMGGISYGA